MCEILCWNLVCQVQGRGSVLYRLNVWLCWRSEVSVHLMGDLRVFSLCRYIAMLCPFKSFFFFFQVNFGYEQVDEVFLNYPAVEMTAFR